MVCASSTSQVLSENMLKLLLTNILFNTYCYIMLKKSTFEVIYIQKLSYILFIAKYELLLTHQCKNNIIVEMLKIYLMFIF